MAASLRRADPAGDRGWCCGADPDAGSLFVEIEKSAAEAALLGRVTGFEGYEWVRLTGAGWVAPG